MSLLELRKKFLAVLLVSFMALGMAACSSTDDPAEDDAASGGSSSGEAPTEMQCDMSPSLDGCEIYKPDTL